ncbi:WD40 repeat-like protein [Leucogyrophana mollusca]|uniref:WD40 repeat-like protein n=1 Tax=Leucogyrophana mollusca TaxID=85980 RepID=A0ACB8B1P9_9AGAM|nr:WD40 repeat-like protein [Leucogyrophana mollusca]
MSSPSAERTSHPRTKATKVFKGHTDFVESVIYFPDGRHMASGSWDKTIRIWNVESGQQVGESLEHDSKVKAIAVSPDGGKIAGRVEGGVIMWDVVGRKRVREVKIDGHEEQGAYALMVSFSPNGRWIATASSDSTSIQLWDVDTGRPVRELQQHVDVIWCLSFSPDGAHIAAGSFVGSFRVLDISTGNTVVGPIQGHADAVTSLVYSPDSRLLVTGSYDKSIRVWDAATGREVGRPMLPRSAIQCIAMSADGKRIASASSDQTVRLWNLETRLQVFQGHSSSIESVAYFPDGRHIASGSRDKTIRIWNVESGKQQGEGLKHDAKVKAIAIAPDGMKIAGRVVGGLIVWDVVRRKRLREIKTDDDSEQSAYALIVAFSPDGRWIATASSASTSIQLWDVDTGSPVRELQQHVDVIWCLSFSPDGAHIATGSFKGSFRVLEISTGKTVVGPVQGHAGAVRSLVYSPDNRLLVTASADGNIRAWDPATGREMGGPMLQPKNVIRCVSISTDGKRIASASSDRILRLWNLETRLQVGDSFAGRPSDWKHSVAFSPNARFVVSGGTQDVYLWDTTVVLDSAVSVVPNSIHMAPVLTSSFRRLDLSPAFENHL